MKTLLFLEKYLEFNIFFVPFQSQVCFHVLLLIHLLVLRSNSLKGRCFNYYLIYINKICGLVHISKKEHVSYFLFLNNFFDMTSCDNERKDSVI